MIPWAAQLQPIYMEVTIIWNE